MSEFRLYCNNCGAQEHVQKSEDTDIPTQCPVCSGTDIRDIVLTQPNKTYAPVSDSDDNIGNNSFYYSTDRNKLVYKDSSGVVHELYV